MGQMPSALHIPATGPVMGASAGSPMRKNQPVCFTLEIEHPRTDLANLEKLNRIPSLAFREDEIREMLPFIFTSREK
jgi:hypothetical protein